MKSIGIVGCGPAGLSAAIALHDAGHQVCLYEQFDQPRPVGSGLMLQPTGLDILDRFGLRDKACALGQRIDGMLGRVAPNGKIVLDISYKVLKGKHSTDIYGVAIHRAALFHVLYEAVQQRSIPIVTNTVIESVAVTHQSTSGTEHKTQLINSDGDYLEPKFDCVVDASGAQSTLARTVGRRQTVKHLEYGALWTTVNMDEDVFDSTLLEQRYDAASVMVGVMPCGRLPGEQNRLATLFWSIRTDQFKAFKAKGLAAWKHDVEKQWPAVACLLSDIDDIDQLIQATYSHHTLSKPYAPGIVFIGDAAHATSPQLGQGANMALLDAYALSQAMASTDNFNEFALLYARMRRRHVRLFQAASYALTPFYQSDNRVLPAVRDFMFEPVSKLPFAKRLVTSLGSGLLTQPIRQIDRLSEQTKLP